MFRTSDAIRVRKVQNVRGGRGEVTFYDWMLPEEAPGHGRVFSKIVMPPGSSIGWHVHEKEFEAFYIISGQATINDNGEKIVLNPGDMHICLTGNGHETENLGSEVLVMQALVLNDLTLA